MIAAMIALIQASPVPGSVEGMSPSDAAASAKQLADQYLDRFAVPDAALAAPRNQPPPEDKARKTLNGAARTVKNLPNAGPIPLGGVAGSGLATGIVGDVISG